MLDKKDSRNIATIRTAEERKRSFWPLLPRNEGIFPKSRHWKKRMRGDVL